MLESGWEELGMDDQWAARVATDLVDDDQPAGGIDFYKVLAANFTRRASASAVAASAPPVVLFDCVTTVWSYCGREVSIMNTDH